MSESAFHDPNLYIYRASAGSGKTFNLACRYICAAFESPIAYQSVLAVTFTNKAANEMRQRILRELNVLAVNAADSPFYKEIKSKYKSFSISDIEKRARDVRDGILHNYSDFHVKTIDKFVQGVLRSFAYDINVNSGFRTVTDSDSVMNDVLSLLYDQIGVNQFLTSSINHIVEDNINNNNYWDFRPSVKNLSNMIFSEDYVAFDNAVASGLDLSLIRGRVNEILKQYNDFFDETYKQATAVFDKIIDKSKMLTTLYNYFKNLKNIDDKKLARPVETVKQMYNNFDAWHKKKVSPSELESAQFAYDNLNHLLVGLFDIVKKPEPYFTAKVIKKNFDALSIIASASDILRKYRADNNIMLISDATRFLYEIVKNNDAPFIYERSGNKFNHILIDEFQDTSGFQWNNFKPLIENSLAQGYDNLIVGDVKQSIYRWRNGDWTLLQSVVKNQIGDDAVKFKTLDTNYRSKSNIIKFNNLLFYRAAQILDKLLATLISSEDNDLPNLKQYLDFSISDLYFDSYQKIPDSPDKEGGSVIVNFYSDEKEEILPGRDYFVVENTPFYDFDVKALNFTAKEIDTLLKSGKYTPGDICILVRTNAQATTAVNFILNYIAQTPDAVKYDVLSGESLLIENSPAVKAVVNAMRYVYDSHNDKALAVAIQSFLIMRSTIENFCSDDIFQAIKTKDFPAGMIPEDFISKIDSLSVLPLYELAEEVVRLFGAAEKSSMIEYVRTFLDVVLKFSTEDSSDLMKFLDWWNVHGGSEAIKSSADNAVEVTTVHKSKGLDYRVVFVPFCDWKICKTSDKLWLGSPQGTPFADLPPLPINYSESLSYSWFAHDYFIEKADSYADSLNILYVALTRAVENMYLCCPVPKKDSSENFKISNVGHLIYQVFCTNITFQRFDSAGNEYFDISKCFKDDCIIVNDNYNPVLPEAESDSGLLTLSRFPLGNMHSRIKIRQKAGEFFAQHNPFVLDKINYGLFMHEIMSKISTADNVNEHLDFLEVTGRISHQQREDLYIKFQHIFSIDIVRDWFSGKRKVKTEDGILTADGKIRIPDRVLIGNNETIVIDFKFGAKHPEYKDQIKEYCSLLSQMGYKNISGYLYYVEKDEVEKTV